MSHPIEDYALLGDGETAALLNRDGSIDWLCWPRFDDDACFAALLGTAENGHWLLAPMAPVTQRSRRYQDDTLVMETDFATAEGAVRITDFMPMRKGASALVRIVVGLRGTTSDAMRAAPALRLRRVSALARVVRLGMWWPRIGPDLVVLRAPVELAIGAGTVSAEFEVSEGDRRAFVLSYGRGHEPPPPPIDAEAALADTQAFWRGWIGRFDDGKTDWPAQVRRSLDHAEGADPRADRRPDRGAHHIAA